MVWHPLPPAGQDRGGTTHKSSAPPQAYTWLTIHTSSRHDRPRHHHVRLTANEHGPPKRTHDRQGPGPHLSRYNEHSRQHDPLLHPPRLAASRHSTHRRRAKAEEQGPKRSGGSWRKGARARSRWWQGKGTWFPWAGLRCSLGWGCCRKERLYGGYAVEGYGIMKYKQVDSAITKRKAGDKNRGLGLHIFDSYASFGILALGHLETKHSYKKVSEAKRIGWFLRRGCLPNPVNLCLINRVSLSMLA